MNGRMKQIGMRDVALKAGVSIAAVSKALNNKPDISDELRKKILTICDNLGYQVNTSIQDMVRSRRSGETKNLAFVIVGADFSTPAYSGAIDGVARAARENGFHLMLDRMSGEERTRYDLPPILRDGRVDGIILTGILNIETVSLLRGLRIPYVILGAYGNRITEGSVNVLLDIGLTVDSIVGGLKAMGKRRLAYLTEDATTYYERESLNAFKSALTENGLELLEELIYFGKGDDVSVFTRLEEIFRRESLPFDGVVCLDFTTAQNLSYLIKGYYGIDREPAIAVGTIRPSPKDTLPGPAVYGELLFEKVSYEGVKVLLETISSKAEFVSRRILLKP